jgi:hypothetical protein
MILLALAAVMKCIKDASRTNLTAYRLLEMIPMAKGKKEKPFKPRIIHTMADGSVRNSVERYPVPVNETTITAYRILAFAGKDENKDR